MMPNMSGTTGNLYLANKALNELEIKEGKTVLKSKLRKLIVVLTNRCNLNCIMCTRKRDSLFLPDSVISQIRTVFPYLDFISWQGGEVFLVDYFKDILEEASRYQYIQQEITTNGTLITEDWAKLISKTRVRLIFSIDSLVKETYEYIRKGARFEDMLAGVSMLKQARRDYGKPDRLDFINIVVMRSNYRELEKFVDFALDNNFDGLNFMYLDDTLVPEENIFQPMDLVAVEYLKETMPKILDSAGRHGLGVSCEFSPLLAGPAVKNGAKSGSDNKELLCLLPWLRVCIDSSRGGAEVFPECLCKKSVGNLLEDDLNMIWNNELMQAYRLRILNHDYAGWCNDKCASGLVNKDFLHGG
jgi:MoaA/NifB/PqqE/SkfB family radical SAM enzyme